MGRGELELKKMLFIYNPKAGTGQIRNNLSHILEEFAQNEYMLTVHPTISAGDARDAAREQGRGYDLIVCSGGDGTLDEVVTGMMEGEFRTPIGYIPAGSTNDFASSLDIPKEMRKAAAAIAHGQVFSCDVGRLNDNYFIYVAAFGVFTEVSYKTSQEWKNAIGHLAYLLEGVKSLSTLKSWKLEYRSAERSGKGEFLYGMITNSNSVGGFKGITGQDVTLNDGMFEVTLIEMPPTFVEWPAIINALMTGKHHDRVVTFKTSRVEFYSEVEVPWTRDGEYGGAYTHAVIENIHRALPLVLGKQPEILMEEETEEI